MQTRTHSPFLRHTHTHTHTRPTVRHTHTCAPSNRWGRIQRYIYTQRNTNTVY